MTVFGCIWLDQRIVNWRSWWEKLPQQKPSMWFSHTEDKVRKKQKKRTKKENTADLTTRFGTWMHTAASLIRTNCFLSSRALKCRCSVTMRLRTSLWSSVCSRWRSASRRNTWGRGGAKQGVRAGQRRGRGGRLRLSTGIYMDTQAGIPGYGLTTMSGMTL